MSPCTKDQEWYENSALYVINLGGGSERKLTDGINGDYDPSWAPSELILFTSRESNQPNLYTIDPVLGGAPKSLTQHSWNYRGDWSADGQSIAFVSTRLSPVPKVFTMPALGELDSAGGQAKEFSRGQEFAYNQPRYSPDGQFLMFRKTVPNTSSPAELVGSKLEDIGLKESNIASYQSVGPFNDADYSPDGKWIVYEGWPDAEHNIYIMTANGSNVRQVTSGGSFNFDPAWRPILEP